MKMFAVVMLVTGLILFVLAVVNIATPNKYEIVDYQIHEATTAVIVRKDQNGNKSTRVRIEFEDEIIWADVYHWVKPNAGESCKTR